MKYYIISGINQSFVMRATTLAEAEKEAKILRQRLRIARFAIHRSRWK